MVEQQKEERKWPTSVARTVVRAAKLRPVVAAVAAAVGVLSEAGLLGPEAGAVARLVVRLFGS